MAPPAPAPPGTTRAGCACNTIRPHAWWWWHPASTWWPHRDSDDSTTRIALSANPLGLLLARPLRLSGDISVTDIQRGAGILQVSLARTSNPAQGLLSLVFSDRSGTLALIGLQAVDARGQRTRFALLEARAGLELDPSLFKPPAS